ncbi:MAG: ADP-ribosylglycohydrolase family protein [Pseudanabaena sp.]|jgi:ADP-ribosylglycohydrolase|nr:ADP-ribosylglycohydrolase family protein [Pseudanabaena sp. M090S1SP2A07QC]MCA6507513.1 ADP-ribosylglycohydrolase family protein [Pseudanabaena sp. M172S2SP2A07QC]MCA6522647.1 ADP-ribosylglycohydrolase family protein [Pseudanabaena sp. M051S1SP2A07QC]MCA6525596.1 ADP-ribosylglycohydrolase family protein [Pseudanabaena sp. M179S2SP2A07QC]MCA6529780.1 ADP-ribosylglycohydrolase family protein [Pseudanabaena sp. M125S2SP2A07QC]MCA6533144.1 ADP-ribosylglycohydrolase family protein [Pseudanabaena
MLGAIVGDIVGSIYEFNNHRSKDFPLFGEDCKFTDDTVLTVAVADCLMNNGNYTEYIKNYARKYTGRGYGGRFRQWVSSESMEPYNSWGNGSAMRVSAVGFAYNDLATIMLESQRSAEVTHNHPQGIRGAQATAVVIFMARQGQSKEEIRETIAKSFGYNLNRTVDKIRPVYVFNESCQGTVPEAIIAFLESTDFEDAIRNAISLGGDSDTLTCITGGIAEAFYDGVPTDIAKKALSYLDSNMREVVEKFYGSLSQSEAG